MFPDPEGLLQKLKARGLKICLWINPYIAQKSPLFREAMNAGYLLKRPNGDVWQWDMWQAGMGIVDFTNPEACDWYQAKLKHLLDMGVDCFKTDFGERIPTDCQYFDGSDPELMHNYYTFLYNRCVFEVLEAERGEGEACVFARSATVGSQRFPLHWGGDSTSTFPSMAETLRGGLSLSASGFSFWSHAELVNRDHLLESTYVPADLAKVTVKCTSSSRIELREEAAEALQKMFDDAALVTEYTYQAQDSDGSWKEKQFSGSNGLRLILKSGYRSYGTQKTTYQNYLARNNGVDDGISSPPGASEHQSGYACDVLSVDYNANNQYMNDSFYQTPEAQWMAENCYSYGFILRYPKDKEDITKVPYEPWHLRYVGREIAGYIKVSGLSLEEFTQQWQTALDDFKAAGGDPEAQKLLEATQKQNGMESTVLDVYGDDGDAEVSLTF